MTFYGIGFNLRSYQVIITRMLRYRYLQDRVAQADIPENARPVRVVNLGGTLNMDLLPELLFLLLQN